MINEGLVLHVIDDLKRRYDLAKTTVGLLGMAFKAESDDMRASLSYKFKNVADRPSARGADHRSVRHHRSRAPAARRGDRAAATS